MSDDRLPEELEALIAEAARLVRDARHLVAFTGAGVSVESGIPPFRGNGGLWSRYDPKVLDIDFFHANPGVAWPAIKAIFYDFFAKAEPNPAHLALAELERRGLLKTLITQNIDDLHFRAGSRGVVEYHGNSRLLRCLQCGSRYEAAKYDLSPPIPVCHCGGLLKPDFVFFGERIPAQAVVASEAAVRRCDVLLVIGTTGEVYPAALLPREAKDRGATVIEINPDRSSFTDEVTDLFLPLPAGRAMVAVLALAGRTKEQPRNDHA